MCDLCDKSENAVSETFVLAKASKPKVIAESRKWYTEQITYTAVNRISVGVCDDCIAKEKKKKSVFQLIGFVVLIPVAVLILYNEVTPKVWSFNQVLLIGLTISVLLVLSLALSDHSSRKNVTLSSLQNAAKKKLNLDNAKMAEGPFVFFSSDVWEAKQKYGFMDGDPIFSAGRSQKMLESERCLKALLKIRDEQEQKKKTNDAE